MKQQHTKQTPLQVEYAQLAADYDERWLFYIKATTQETIKHLRILSGKQLLDVGCGTGGLLQDLQSSVADVSMFGVDPSLEMLHVARKKNFSVSGSSTSICLSAAWAESLPFPDCYFDVVISCNSLHYWQQAEAGIQEMARVLQPNGKIIITDWCNNYLSCRINDLYLRVFNRAHVKTYNSKECSDMLAAVGFINIKMTQYKINWLWGMMTVTAEKPCWHDMTLA